MKVNICLDGSDSVVVYDKEKQEWLTDVVVLYPKADKDSYQVLSYIEELAQSPKISSFASECHRYWEDVTDGVPHE